MSGCKNVMSLGFCSGFMALGTRYIAAQGLQVTVEDVQG